MKYNLTTGEFIPLEVTSGTTIECACAEACEMATARNVPVRFDWSSGGRSLIVEVKPGTDPKDVLASWEERMAAPHPIGVCPRSLWIENRRAAVASAIERYQEAGFNFSNLSAELEWLKANAPAHVHFEIKL